MTNKKKRALILFSMACLVFVGAAAIWMAATQPTKFEVRGVNLECTYRADCPTPSEFRHLLLDSLHGMDRVMEDPGSALEGLTFRITHRQTPDCAPHAAASRCSEYHVLVPSEYILIHEDVALDLSRGGYALRMQMMSRRDDADNPERQEMLIRLFGLMPDGSWSL